MELIKLRKSGFHNFLFAKGTTKALCAFKDGAVGVSMHKCRYGIYFE